MSLLLDIVEVAESHTGVNLAAAFAKILDDYGIFDKVIIIHSLNDIYIEFSHQILGITCDNASANDTMIERLAQIMSNFSGEANRARCLAHIVNLVAKIILRQFDMPKRNKNSKNNEPGLDNEGEYGNDDEGEDGSNDDETARVLDKEEKEMDNGDSDGEAEEEQQNVARDVEIMEEVMAEEIVGVVNDVKPVRQVLLKVSLIMFAVHVSIPWAIVWEKKQTDHVYPLSMGTLSISSLCSMLLSI